MSTRPTLDEIAHREKNPELWTDKKSHTPGFICHDYLRIYEREFSKWRDSEIHLLEIGVNKGASIKLWLEYFTYASIYGVDINPFKNEVGIPAGHRAIQILPGRRLRRQALGQSFRAQTFSDVGNRD